MRQPTALAAIAAAFAIGALALVTAFDRDDTTDAPAAPATSTGPSESSPAQVTSFSLPSPLVDPSGPGGELDDGRSAPKVTVLLPSGYHDDPEASYPVLWVLHGADHGADGWLPGIEALADGLPAIVVMPDGGLYGMYADWWSDGARSAPAWATFHLETVRHEVEARFRVREGRRWHAIAGVSMGGQGALRYAALMPGYFGAVAAFSAAMPDMQSEIAVAQVAGLAGDDATYDDIFGPTTGAYAEGNSPRALAPNLAHTRVFLTSGDGTNCDADPVNPDSIDLDAAIETVINGEQTSFAEVARRAGADVTAETTCGVHTFGVWDRAFTTAREWDFFAPVPDEPTEWAYRTVATSGEVWGLDYEFSTPPTAVATIERAGDTITATGDGTLTLGSGSCRIEAPLPFSRALPEACPSTSAPASPGSP